MVERLCWVFVWDLVGILTAIIACHWRTWLVRLSSNHKKHIGSYHLENELACDGGR